MQREMFKSKLHRGRVTATEIEYEGSVTIDETLLDAAGICEHERVQIVNVSNGERLETYTIAGDSGEICLNGAAGRLAEPDDIVIVISYGMYTQDEGYSPTTVLLDEHNDIVSIE